MGYTDRVVSPSKRYKEVLTLFNDLCIPSSYYSTSEIKARISISEVAVENYTRSIINKYFDDLENKSK